MTDDTQPNSNIAVQKQQIDSNSQKPGGSMSSQETQVSADAAVVEALEPVAATLSFSDLIKNETSMYNIRTRLMLTISPREHATLPDVASINDVNYSFQSPLRQGDGSFANPKGAVREALRELTAYLGEINRASSVTLLADANTVKNTVTTLADRIRSEVEPIMLAFNGGKHDFSLPSNLLKVAAPSSDDLPADVAEEGEIDLGENDTTPVKFNVFDNILNITVSPSIIDDTIEIVVTVNVVCPLLAGAEDLSKFSLIHRFIENYAEQNGVGAANYSTNLVIDSDTLLNRSTRGILKDFSAPGVEANVIGAQYFYDCALNGEDPFGLYPTDMTAADAVNEVFAFGGDILVVAHTIPKAEKPAADKSSLKKKKFNKV